MGKMINNKKKKVKTKIRNIDVKLFITTQENDNILVWNVPPNPPNPVLTGAVTGATVAVGAVKEGRTAAGAVAVVVAGTPNPENPL